MCTASVCFVQLRCGHVWLRLILRDFVQCNHLVAVVMGPLFIGRRPAAAPVCVGGMDFLVQARTLG